jgi:hypothetical protein
MNLAPRSGLEPGTYGLTVGGWWREEECKPMTCKAIWRHLGLEAPRPNRFRAKLVGSLVMPAGSPCGSTACGNSEPTGTDPKTGGIALQSWAQRRPLLRERETGRSRGAVGEHHDELAAGAGPGLLRLPDIALPNVPPTMAIELGPAPRALSADERSWFSPGTAAPGSASCPSSRASLRLSTCSSINHSPESS